MGNYHDQDLKKGILFLADVFEKFVDTCLKFYKLDLCHYFSSPGLSWDAMLKMTGVELEKISDIEMYLIIEKGLRGGIYYVCKRHSKANNNTWKFMILQNWQNSCYTMIWITCTVRERVGIFVLVDLSG